MKHFLLLTTFMLMVATTRAEAEVTIVEKGKARSLIVLPVNPTEVARYAAQELKYHVAEASGVELQIAAENAVVKTAGNRIYIGDCDRTRAAGIEATRLAADSFVIRCTGGELFVAGRDAEGDPLGMRTWAGTLFAVYELLDSVMGVRWLWPGELGEIIPMADTIVVPNMDRKVEPQLLWRNLRSTLHLRPREEGHAGFSGKAIGKVKREQSVFLRRHRMGYAVDNRYGHAFTGWWDRYGKEHPEWFNLMEDGKRHGGRRQSMCVSNPGFHRQIIENWKQKRAANPGKFININGCENDVYGTCQCDNCKAWDGPQQEPISARFGEKGTIVSGRYARFLKALRELGSEIDPDAVVMGYAYVNYLPDPGPVKLHPNVWVGFVPDAFFPRSNEDHRWLKEQWGAWRKTGCSVFLRPNYFLDGYCMPYVFAHQFGDEFRYGASHGMIGMDFDSLTAMWSTQGTNLYLLSRMPVRHEEPVDSVLEEYYAGFGPAAKKVREYFDYWERYTTENRERFRAISKEHGGGWSRFPRVAHEFYPQDVFEPGFKLLDEAGKLTKEQPPFNARVDFLRRGLKHARLCAQVGEYIMSPLRQRPTDMRKLRQLREELALFRRSIELDNVANLNYCAWLENRNWKMNRIAEYVGQPLKPLIASPRAMANPPAVSVRDPHAFVVLLTEGESFRARITCSQLGRYESSCHWLLFAPGQDEPVARGILKPNQTEDLNIPVNEKGIHNLIVNGGKNAVAVTLHNHHAALAGHRLHLLGETGPLYFYVPSGTKSFKVNLRTAGPNETATMTIFDPDGKKAASGFTGKNPTYKADIKVNPQHAGRPWRMLIRRAPTGIVEDVDIQLDDILPAYWSIASDRLLVPEN